MAEGREDALVAGALAGFLLSALGEALGKSPSSDFLSCLSTWGSFAIMQHLTAPCGRGWISCEVWGDAGGFRPAPLNPPSLPSLHQARYPQENVTDK